MGNAVHSIQQRTLAVGVIIIYSFVFWCSQKPRR